MWEIRGIFRRTRGLRAVWSEAFEAERGRFVLWLPVFMGTGVLAYFDLTVEPPDWIGAKFALAGFALALAAGRRRAIRAVGLILGFCAAGFASGQFATMRAPPIETGLPATAMIVTGRVRSVEVLPAARRITLDGVRLFSTASPGNDRTLTRAVRLRLKSGDEKPISTGDTIRVRAMIRPPQAPALPGGWDTQRDAFFSGLGALGYALNPVDILASAPPDRLSDRVRGLRETIAARVTRAIPGAEGTVAVTLLTGDSHAIPTALHDAYRASGLAHLLAVAGLHIGIVMGFAFGLTRLALALSRRACLFWPAKQIAATAALMAGAGYMVLTGGHVPIIRSFAMACLMTIGVLTGRPPVSLRGLAFAAIALMAIEPYEVPGVSFQMSFSAVLALISGYESLRPWLRRLQGKSIGRRARMYVLGLGLTSALAGAASLPYGAYHFGHLQVYFVLSNMLAVPLTALWVMPAGLIGLALTPLGWEHLALVPMSWGAALIDAVATKTAALPAATVNAPHLPPWGLAILSLGLAVLGLARSRLRFAGLVGIGLGLASPAFDRPPDILVSGDGGLIGFRTHQGVFLQQSRGTASFARDAWLARWSVNTAQALPTEGWAAEGAITCVKNACIFRPEPDVMAALLIRGPVKQTGCGGAAVVVSAEPARGVCTYPPPRPVDRFVVWKDGPVAVWLEPTGARVLTDREDRGTRPWVPPPPRPKARPVSGLPSASIDRGN